MKALRHWPLSPVPGEFPAQMASNAENVSIWWCHHVDVSPGGAQLTLYNIARDNKVHTFLKLLFFKAAKAYHS